MTRTKLIFKVLAFVQVLLAFQPARGDSPVAPLNGTVSFPSASAPADTLYVNAGQQTIAARSAEQIQGAANARISVVTQQGTGQVHVADVTLRSGDSLYHVSGEYIGGGGSAGSGGTPAGWTADYNNGAPRILLEINGTPSTDDDYVAYGNNGGVLTITLAGGSSSTNYTVNLSSAPSGNPGGQVGFATNSVTLAGGDSKQVALSGLAIGDATITGTEANSLATSGSVLAHVVAVATVKFVPFVDLNPNTTGDRGSVPYIPLNAVLPASLSGNDNQGQVRMALSASLSAPLASDTTLTFSVNADEYSSKFVSIPGGSTISVTIPAGQTSAWSNGAENSTSTAQTVVVTGIKQLPNANTYCSVHAQLQGQPSGIKTPCGTHQSLLVYNVLVNLSPADSEFVAIPAKTLNTPYAAGPLSMVIPPGATDALQAVETPGGSSQVGTTPTAPDAAANQYKFSSVNKIGAMAQSCAAGTSSAGPATYFTGATIDHNLIVKVNTAPPNIVSGASVTASFHIDRQITFNSSAVTTNVIPNGTQISLVYGNFGVAVPISTATQAIAGGNHCQQYTSPSGILSPASGAFSVGAESNAQANLAPGLTNSYGNTDSIVIAGLTTTIDTAQGQYKSQMSSAAERVVNTPFIGSADVYGSAAKPQAILTSATITALP